MTDYPITEFKGVYRWLSNFWPVQVELDGRVYPTVENAYQAAKSTTWTAICFASTRRPRREPRAARPNSRPSGKSGNSR